MKTFILIFLISLVGCETEPPTTYSKINWLLETQEDELANPVTKISLIVDKRYVEIESALNVEALPKITWINHNIPDDALAACGGWWAGQGAYYYVVKKNDKLQILKGYAGEGMDPKDEYQYEVIKNITRHDLYRIILFEEDNNTLNDATVGETILIKLPSNPSTGYKWDLIESGYSDYLYLENSEFISTSNKAEIVGTGGYEIFELSPLAEGTTEILLEYRRGWEKETATSKLVTYRFSISERPFTATAIILTSLMILFVIAVITLLISYHLRARKHVYKWAQENNYRVLSLRNLLLLGPFYFGTSKAQRVFRASVITEDGNVEKLYIKVGDYWKGVLKFKVEEKWDKYEKSKLP